uniref:Ovule protein n=1 Tax=Heterorhabditis bacteriophora TaxID=37862 RepID=A0A1I7WR16_HETBA
MSRKGMKVSLRQLERLRLLSCIGNQLLLKLFPKKISFYSSVSKPKYPPVIVGSLSRHFLIHIGRLAPASVPFT